MFALNTNDSSRFAFDSPAKFIWDSTHWLTSIASPNAWVGTTGPLKKIAAWFSSRELAEWFPEREFFMRSQGQVRFITITSKMQIAAAS